MTKPRSRRKPRSEPESESDVLGDLREIRRRIEHLEFALDRPGLRLATTRALVRASAGIDEVAAAHLEAELRKDSALPRTAADALELLGLA